MPAGGRDRHFTMTEKRMTSPESTIAIVGAAGIFPDADDIETFWKNIVAGHCAITPVPSERWGVPREAIQSVSPPTGIESDKVRSLHAGVIGRIPFDPVAFNLPTGLEAVLDPLHRLVLTTGHMALEDCVGRKVDRERTGVILASIALPTETASALTREVYAYLVETGLFPASPPRAPHIDACRALAARVTAFPAALLASSLNLGGGTFTLDAARASSLYAVKLACDELRAGRVDTMLVGGAARTDLLYTQMGFTQLQALSPTGRCAPFDASADGLVVGEGCGCIVLRRLSDARRDGDRIYGLVAGAGVSNDMRGNLLAPDTEGQLRAMRMAYRQAGWQPSDVDLIECHGAGTPLGDRVELQSLAALWQNQSASPGQCPIGSIKSMTGHLLTGAGMAGLLKVLMGMQHNILPPSLGFENAPADSPLDGGPFRVQTAAAPWERRDRDRPRRAAVSAFGFGGINAHLLVEAYRPDRAGPAAVVSKAPAVPLTSISPPPSPDVAIVGMEAHIGQVKGLKAFQEAVFNGRRAFRPASAARWKDCPALVAGLLGGKNVPGNYLEDFEIELGAFGIPPSELDDILPQHLLMLTVAAGALEDATMPHREERPRMGAVIGMEFDLEDTNFHLRWRMPDLVEQWRENHRLSMSPDDYRAWTAALQADLSPPLTHSRTLGSLGGIIASRIARAFRLGGPSFVVSGEELAGLKALSIARQALQNDEVDAMLVGAVDLPGDLRRMAILERLRAFSGQPLVAPFDATAEGTLPGEGAAALVLKRLEDARADGDRIYGLVQGTGSASGVIAIEPGDELTSALALAWQRALEDGPTPVASIDLIETHGSGHPLEDRIEHDALDRIVTENRDPVAVGSAKATQGHTGAAAGLVSVVKAALSLYHRVIPPLPAFRSPPPGFWSPERFHLPARPLPWLRDRQAEPRAAAVLALTTDGNAGAAIISAPPASTPTTSAPTVREPDAPLGNPPFGLFILKSQTRVGLKETLKRLAGHVEAARRRHRPMAETAYDWYRSQPPAWPHTHTLALVLREADDITRAINDAQAQLEGLPLQGKTASFFNPGGPLAAAGELAFVYPGAGNAYAGMARMPGLRWPTILRAEERDTDRLATQLRPRLTMPLRTDWSADWEQAANERLNADPMSVISAQVVYGCQMTRLYTDLGLRPDAVVGYSLGETVGYFATGAWPDRDRMRRRIEASPLFRTELSGPCRAAARAWGFAPGRDVDWRAVLVNRPSDVVRRTITNIPAVHLLIVNTPEECVIGGHAPHVAQAVKRLKAEVIDLEGTVAVHCDAVEPVSRAYYDLHCFETRPPAGIRYYSCAKGEAMALTRESAARSLLDQAVAGFDFARTIRQAYDDGVRLFLEMGPQGSCTRMIGRILGEQPHLAVSTSNREDQDGYEIARTIAALAAEGVVFDLDAYFRTPTREAKPVQPTRKMAVKRIPSGGHPVRPTLPPVPRSIDPIKSGPGYDADRPEPFPDPDGRGHPALAGSRALMERMNAQIAETARAHRQYLEMSSQLSREYAAAFDLQNRLLTRMNDTGTTAVASLDPASAAGPARPSRQVAPPAFSRAMCMEFAVGSAARVLGPEFADLDRYPARVRLPDEPLMLVDRILSIEGTKGQLGPGRIVTEHDVRPGAWYLDADRAPVCISVEAGQADLFLCSYLGIDHKVRGARTYRLLDAAVTFHRGLPRPGDVIRYEIAIEKFIRQGSTWLFFFHFDGFIGGEHLISMRDGCAGFFTAEEVLQSGGILLKEEDSARVEGRRPADWLPPVPLVRESYNDAAVDALRRGDAAACFGEGFGGVTVPPNLRLPGGRMRLLERVLSVDPEGGRYGLGSIRAEADIHPDDWFLTCHFVDDMVMPGTLMYECCAHTLRILLQRMGWIGDAEDVCYEPVVGNRSVLKCRGPVTPDTRHVVYTVEISEIGFNPAPFVLADAHMYADGHYIVMFRGMSMQMSGMTRESLDAFWQTPRRTASAEIPRKDVFSREQILAFARGKPSDAFGAPYRPFDRERFIARLPAPPYAFISRVSRVDAMPWELKPDGWAHIVWDMRPDDWYFRAHRSDAMPLCILMEIALQACGFLAAYMGSALKSEKDLRFRNLDGRATLEANVRRDRGPVSARARLLSASMAGDMLIEQFAFEVFQQDHRVYAGETSFGFFTEAALNRQVGLGKDDRSGDWERWRAVRPANAVSLANIAPLTPDDPGEDDEDDFALPAAALRMIDRIDRYDPQGGEPGLGYLQATKKVDPQAWFFEAHFFQDPVCPGSLGIESLIQLLRWAARQRWPALAETHMPLIAGGSPHTWRYRGQIRPDNSDVTVEAVITAIEDGPEPALWADGYLKVDGLCIYKMQNFGLRLVDRRSFSE